MSDSREVEKEAQKLHRKISILSNSDSLSFRIYPECILHLLHIGSSIDASFTACTHISYRTYIVIWSEKEKRKGWTREKKTCECTIHCAHHCCCCSCFLSIEKRDIGSLDSTSIHSFSLGVCIWIYLFNYSCGGAGKQPHRKNHRPLVRPPLTSTTSNATDAFSLMQKSLYMWELYSVQSTFVVAWPAKRKILNICTTEKEMKKGKTSGYVRYVAFIGFDRKAELWVVGGRRERELKDSGRPCTQEQDQDRWDCNSDISFQTYRLSNPLCLFIKRNVRLFK